MGVKVRKLRGSWYVVIDHKGRRKTKHIGSKEAAELAQKKLEIKLAEGDLGVFSNEQAASPRFSEYADRWLEKHVGIKKKPATVRVYGVMMENHIKPFFGAKPLDAVTESQIEDFIYSLVTKQKNGATEYTQATIKLINAVLKSFFAYAKRMGAVTLNPTPRLKDLAKSDKPSRSVESMTRKEAELFLQAAEEVCPDQYAFFLCALRTGMRRGELIGLQWGDIAFGQDEHDSDRYIMVQRTYGNEGFGSPKSGKSRRVDMSKQLRSVLLQLREDRLLSAMQQGKDSIASDLVFHENGQPINPQLLAARYMEPALSKAGLRRFTPHCLRHTFAVLSLQAGAPLKYVSEQLGHSSIVLTADRYGKFQPGVNVHLVDMLDSRPQTNANPAQTGDARPETIHVEHVDGAVLTNVQTSHDVLTMY